MIEHSYGIIPVYKNDNELRVFVIHQYGSAGDMLWTFPKGRPEAGETPEATAVRELYEETGLQLERIISDTPLSISYTFVRDGEKIEKTTTYFIGFVERMDVALEETEIKEGAWLLPHEARERLTYEGYKKILDDMLVHLDKSLKNSYK